MRTDFLDQCTKTYVDMSNINAQTAQLFIELNKNCLLKLQETGEQLSPISALCTVALVQLNHLEQNGKLTDLNTFQSFYDQEQLEALIRFGEAYLKAFPQSQLSEEMVRPLSIARMLAREHQEQA